MQFRQRIFLLPLGGILALIGACSGNAADNPTGFPAEILVVAGSTQVAPVNSELPELVRFLVVDQLGNPVPGVKVKIDVEAGEGDIPVVDQITTAQGTVQTPWVLGPISGDQAISARVKGLNPAVVRAQATGCAKPECLEYDITEDTPEEMGLPTYDYSNQVVHPDIALQTRNDSYPWYWMAITPYPNGNSFYENPSIFRSFNGKYWRVPKGLVNPVAWPTEAHLSDPDMVYDSSSSTFWLYYRSVSQTSNTIMAKRSSDGIQWGPAENVLKVPSHQAVSPAVVRGAPEAPWMMWVVDAGSAGCVSLRTSVQLRVSVDGLHWSAAQLTNLVQPGEIIWHLDMAWVPARGEYWALYTTYPAGTKCTTNHLYLATSRDGLTWQTPTTPIVRAGSNPIFEDIIYRSSMMTSPDGNKTTIWLSGANYDVGGGYRWKAATIRYSTADLMAISYGPRTGGAVSPVKTWLPSPEPYDIGIGN